MLELYFPIFHLEELSCLQANFESASQKVNFKSERQADRQTDRQTILSLFR